MKRIPHRTQEEKSKVMRLRLIEATLACLQELGYHGASLTQILKRADVSRGAWRHHYSSKKELMAAAAEHFLQGPVTSARELVVKSKIEDADIGFLIEYVWNNFYQGPYRDIWLEFHVACRTDMELRQRLAPVIRRFFVTLDELWQANFRTTGKTDVGVDVLLNLTLYVMRGMAIQSIIIEDADYYRGLRSQWLRMVSPLIAVSSDG